MSTDLVIAIVMIRPDSAKTLSSITIEPFDPEEEETLQAMDSHLDGPAVAVFGAAGVFGYLIKPVNAEALQAQIEVAKAAQVFRRMSSGKLNTVIVPSRSPALYCAVAVSSSHGCASCGARARWTTTGSSCTTRPAA